MKRKLFAISLAAMLLLAGCGSSVGNSTGAADMPASSAPSGGELESDDYWDMDMNGAEMMPSAPEPDMPGNALQDGSVYQNTNAKLIRRADLHIQTEQFDQSQDALKQLVATCNGYFELASVYGGGRRDANANRSGEYTVRIPAEKYSQFFNSTGDLGYVTNSTESSEDVGQKYYDIEARLKTQRTKQERLLALLERAESMEDIIALESALSDVEFQIELYSSDLNRYDALIGFSTFQIYLNEVGKVTQDVGETASLSQRMVAGFQASIRNLVQGFQNLLIWVSYNLFLTIILTGAAVAAVIVGRRKLKKFGTLNTKKSEDE